MEELRCSFKCAECGGAKLRLAGVATLNADVSFSFGFSHPETDSEYWDVGYAMPEDGPRAFIVCDKCAHEVKVSCLNEHTGRTAVLWPAEIYQMLWGTVRIYGTYDGQAFNGSAKLDLKKFLGKLVAAHPQLGNKPA